MVKKAGWQRIGPDPKLAAWAKAAVPLAHHAIADSKESWRCGGTWFAGVDALPNHADGSVQGCGFPWSSLPLDPVPLHPAQLSTIKPGYPQPSAEETPAAQKFRRDRDAAHLDGLLPMGPDRRRMVKEPHAFILGIALNDCGAGASPLVVWEGSHTIMQEALSQALSPYAPEVWGDVDVTEPYQAARRRVFETCRRVELPIRPGEATLLHRFVLHGVAPWQDGASAPAQGRIIAYFRPMLPSVQDWIMLP